VRTYTRFYPTSCGFIGAALGFLMYPQAETAEGRIDPLDADNLKYQIAARKIA